MSVECSSRAWSVKGLSFAEKLVLLRLADAANSDGVCWPSFGRIALDVGIDIRSVRRIAARLEAKGLLSRQARFRKNGLQGSNWLVVLPPDDRRAASDDAVMPEVVAVLDSRTGGSGSDRAVLPDPDRAVLPDPDRAVLPRGDRAVLPEPSIETKSEPSGAASVDPSSLTAFERSKLLAGQSVMIGGRVVKPDSREGIALARAVRSASAEN